MVLETHNCILMRLRCSPSYLSTDRSAHLVPRGCNLHPTIQCPAVRGGIIRDRLGRAKTLGSEATRIHTMRLQPCNDRGGAILRQYLVVRAVSLVVGVASDCPTRSRMIVNEPEHRLERGRAVRPELRESVSK